MYSLTFAMPTEPANPLPLVPSRPPELAPRPIREFPHVAGREVPPAYPRWVHKFLFIAPEPDYEDLSMWGTTTYLAPPPLSIAVYLESELDEPPGLPLSRAAGHSVDPSNVRVVATQGLRRLDFASGFVQADSHPVWFCLYTFPPDLQHHDHCLPAFYVPWVVRDPLSYSLKNEPTVRVQVAEMAAHAEDPSARALAIRCLEAMTRPGQALPPEMAQWAADENPEVARAARDVLAAERGRWLVRTAGYPEGTPFDPVFRSARPRHRPWIPDFRPWPLQAPDPNNGLVSAGGM